MTKERPHRQGFRWVLGLAVGGPLVFGCTNQTMIKARANQPPAITKAVIRPASPRVGDNVNAEVTYRDADHDEVILQYRWTVDGKVVAEGTGSSLPEELVESGVEIGLEVRALDERKANDIRKLEEFNWTDWYPAKSVKVEVREVELKAVRLAPREAFETTVLEAEVDTGSEEVDPADLYYRWKVNRQIVADADGTSLDGEAFDHGDEVTVEVSTREEFPDRYTWGAAPVKIANSPPVFTTGVDFDWEGKTLTATVAAEDDDQDPLSFSLKNAPPGMTVGKESGELRWQPRPGQTGSFSVTVAVSDGQGGKAEQVGEIELTAPTGP